MTITTEQALAWKRMYEEDAMTIEAISLESGSSTTTVAKWLRKMDTTMRTPGAARGKRVVNPRYQMDGKGKNAGIRVAATRKSFTGHRRRSFR